MPFWANRDTSNKDACLKYHIPHLNWNFVAFSTLFVADSLFVEILFWFSLWWCVGSRVVNKFFRFSAKRFGNSVKNPCQAKICPFSAKNQQKCWKFGQKSRVFDRIFRPNGRILRSKPRKFGPNGRNWGQLATLHPGRIGCIAPRVCWVKPRQPRLQKPKIYSKKNKITK